MTDNVGKLLRQLDFEPNALVYEFMNFNNSHKNKTLKNKENLILQDVLVTWPKLLVVLIQYVGN